MPRLLLVVVIALAAAGCDQVSKLQAIHALTDGAALHPKVLRSVTVIDGLWRLAYAENPGAAFSFFADSPFGRWLLTGAGLAFVAMLTVHARKQRSLALQLASALIIGGAIGNLLDRLRLGYVVDFIQWHYGDLYAWPTFNLADVWIFVGAVLWLCAQGSSSRELQVCSE